MTTKITSEMCVTEEKVEKIVDDKLDLLEANLTKAFDKSFGKLLVGAAETKKDLEYIKKQTTLTNSRTNNHEDAIKTIRHTLLQRESNCPFASTIKEYKEDKTAAEAIEDMLDTKQEEEAAAAKKLYHRLQAYGAIITAVVVILAFGIDVVDIIKAVLSRF